MVDESAAVRGVAAAFLTLAAIAVILRCYVRLRIVKAFGWDDFIMIIAMIFYITFCACMIGGSLWGTGKHLSELSPKNRTVAMEYWFLCDIAYLVSSILAKVSICIFLCRVMVFPCQRIALYAVTVLIVTTGIVFFVLMVIRCSPVSYFWTRVSGDLDGKCGYVDAIEIMLYIFSVSSALFDLTVGLLPIILVRKLQMNRRTKAAVAGLLGMACVASIANIIRIPFVQTIHDPDYLYATVQMAIWSCIEVGLSITAGSLATTRPLFRILYSRPAASYQMFDASTPKRHQQHQHPRLFPTANDARNQHQSASQHSITDFFESSFGHARASSLSSSRTAIANDENSNNLNLYDHWLMSLNRGVGMGASSSEVTARPSVDGEHPVEYGFELELEEGGGNGRGGQGGISALQGSVASRSRSRIGVRRTFEVSREVVEGDS